MSDSQQIAQRVKRRASAGSISAGSTDAPTASTHPTAATLPRGPFPLFNPDSAARLAIQGWLASRLILLMTVLVLTWVNGWTVAEGLQRWDVLHFIGIATSGYTSLTESAFFPGLPLVMTVFSWVGIPPLVSGMVIAAVGSGFAAWGLYRLAGRSITGTVAVWTWSFAPMTVFTFVPYSEAGFCAFAFWAFWAAKQDRWHMSAWLAAGACVFRVSGLFLIGALGLVALLRPGLNWRERAKRIAYLAIPTAVLASYVVFLRIRFGSWTAWFQAQSEGWGRSFHWPWEALGTTLSAAGITAVGDANSIMFRWELVAAAIGIFVTAWCVWRAKIAEAGWVGVQLLALSCQIWLISLSRTVLLWFPAYQGLSTLGKTSSTKRGLWLRRTAVAVILIGETVGLLWWAVRFFSGAWAS